MGALAMEQNLMPIGKFSSACRLSVKALRHYDEQGLLHPAFVDSNTGYRYYAKEQARRAVSIAMLRGLDLSLAEIRTLLDTRAKERRELLAQHRDRVARDLERTRQTLLAVERIADDGRLFPYEIEVREEPEYSLIQRSCTTTADDMVDDSAALIYELMGSLKARGRNWEPPVLCVNEEPDRDEKIIVHACVGVSEPPPELGDMRVFVLPGGLVAWLTHRGGYETLGLSYHALSAWAQERGHIQRAPVREIYLNDPAETPTEELLTEVLLPIDL